MVSVALATVGRISGMLPILRMALTYPLTNRFRTGVTLSMFTLVVFTLVIGGTVTNAFTQAFNDEDLFGGGFDIRATTVQVNPIADLESAIQAEPNIDGSAIEYVADQSLVPVQARPGRHRRRAGRLPPARYERCLLRPHELQHGGDRQGIRLHGGRLAGREVRPHAGGGRRPGGAASATTSASAHRCRTSRWRASTTKTARCDPTPIEVINPLTGDVSQLTVIGVLQEVIPDYMIGITTSQRFVEAAFPAMATPTTHLIGLQPDADQKAIADSLESAFLDHGMEAVLLSDELNDLVGVNNTFNYLIQGFIGLGLVVGVAALGVVSARTVVERRQEIGVMRAIGFEQGRVQIGFLIESSMVAVAGIVVGTILGLILAYNIIDDTSRQASWSGIQFSVPWLNLAIIYVVVLAAALLTAYLPARQASRVYPAQALRYE